MVKLFFSLLVLSSLSLAGELSEQSLLVQKIETFLGTKTYKQNAAYIDIIFSSPQEYYHRERVDDVKVIQTLKNSGLLNLFFKTPRELTLHFTTSASPLLFVKIMGDTLRNIGYYRYVTKESNLNNAEFTWTIALTSEYATDPLILQQELRKSGCSIINIDRASPTEWSYTIDMRSGKLNVETLEDGVEVKLKRSIYAKWIDVSKVKKLYITSSRRNSWYPYIAYYDSSMHLLELIKRDSKRSKLILNFMDNTHYIKISDIYTLKNIRDDLTLLPSGSK
jgi:hypothetical protein